MIRSGCWSPTGLVEKVQRIQEKLEFDYEAYEEDGTDTQLDAAIEYLTK